MHSLHGRVNRVFLRKLLVFHVHKYTTTIKSWCIMQIDCMNEIENILLLLQSGFSLYILHDIINYFENDRE